MLSDVQRDEQQGKQKFRKRDIVRIIGTEDTGMIFMANNVKGVHLVEIHDKRKRILIEAEKLEKLN